MITTLAAVAATLPFLSPVFGSHMVLQRDRPNPVWGWTSPGAKVHVQLGKAKAEATASATGKWMATLPPLPAGGPYRLQVSGPEQQTLDDIWLGEVWICSGQSNMEFGLTQTKDAAAAVAAANQPMIRLFMPDRQIALSPQETLKGTWKICTPETVKEGGWGGFSGVGYYFGRKLHEKLNVPIGLIQISWGGTAAESWMSDTAVAHAGDFDRELKQLEHEREAGLPALGTYVERYIRDHDEGANANPTWSSPEYSSADWQVAQLPTEVSERHVVWYRWEFDLPAGRLPENATLRPTVAGLDTTWLNGVQVGAGIGEYQRWYGIAPKLFKPGRNVLAMRLAYGYGGGLHLPADQLLIETDKGPIPLGAITKWRQGLEIPAQGGPRDFEPNPTVPTVLFNGWVAPLAPLALRGTIWYQGETNMGRGVQYRKLLPGLIKSWRDLFEDQGMSFHIVSLANWQARQESPVDEYMPELREAQSMTALQGHNSGIAMAYDAGDAEDVHPKDKQTVGERLALCALALDYGQDVEWSGPIFKSMKRDGSALCLSFSHAEHGLKAKGELASFAVAGEDRVWHWATASIDGATVVLTCPQVKEPVAARYAWANNPVATLYNGDGLPAIPFRTDDWPRLSENNR